MRALGQVSQNHMNIYFSRIVRVKFICKCITEPKLTSACPQAVKPVYWHKVVIKESAVFIATVRQGVQSSYCWKALNPSGYQWKIFTGRVSEKVLGCMTSSWTFLWLVGGEIIKNQHYQPSGSNWSVVHVLVGRIQLISSTWWGFVYLQNNLRIWLRTPTAPWCQAYSLQNHKQRFSAQVVE